MLDFALYVGIEFNKGVKGFFHILNWLYDNFLVPQVITEINRCLAFVLKQIIEDVYLRLVLNVDGNVMYFSDLFDCKICNHKNWNLWRSLSGPPVRQFDYEFQTSEWRS